MFFISQQPEVESCSMPLGLEGSASIIKTCFDKSTLRVTVWYVPE